MHSSRRQWLARLWQRTPVSGVTATPRLGDRPVSRTLIAIAGAWIIVLAVAVVWIWDYKTTPGVASGPPATWPESSGLQRTGTTLVVTLHPLCTCSQATISELGRLIASVPNPPTVYALFYSANPAKRRQLEQSSLWQRAAAIPRVATIADRNDSPVFGCHLHDEADAS